MNNSIHSVIRKKKNFHRYNSFYYNKSIMSNFKFVLFKLKKNKDEYKIYPTISIHNNELTYNLACCYLSKIYLYIINKNLEQLYKKYEYKIHSVLFDIIISYLDIGDFNSLMNIYKILINKTLTIKH